VDELVYTDGDVEAVILPEVGARLHRLRVFGHDVLRTPTDPGVHARDPFFWGAFVMAPWCNRIAAGSVRVGSRRISLRPNFPDGSAIHGEVYAVRWERRSDGSIHALGGGNAWPWPYDVGFRMQVRSRVLRVDLSLTNLSDDPMPAGLGLHPWFRRPVAVAIRGNMVLPSNTSGRSRPEPVRGRFDLRSSGEMSSDLDATWTDLAEPPVELRWANVGIRATMRTRPRAPFVVAASPGQLDAIAVEPETHAPHGLERLLAGEPGGLTWLDPGQSLDLGIALGFERSEAAAEAPVSGDRAPGIARGE
jgi:aldose 1-epimerase